MYGIQGEILSAQGCQLKSGAHGYDVDLVGPGGYGFHPVACTVSKKSERQQDEIVWSTGSVTIGSSEHDLTNCPDETKNCRNWRKRTGLFLILSHAKVWGNIEISQMSSYGGNQVTCAYKLNCIKIKTFLCFYQFASHVLAFNRGLHCRNY